MLVKWVPVASFTKEVHPLLAKRPLKGHPYAEAQGRLISQNSDVAQIINKFVKRDVFTLMFYNFIAHFITNVITYPCWDKT